MKYYLAKWCDVVVKRKQGGGVGGERGDNTFA